MTKFTVLKSQFEFNPRKYTIEDALDEYGMENARPIAMVDTIEEAREVLKGLGLEQTFAYKYNLHLATVAYIEEADREFNEGTETWDLVGYVCYWDVTYNNPKEIEDEDDEDGSNDD